MDTCPVRQTRQNRHPTDDRTPRPDVAEAVIATGDDAVDEADQADDRQYDAQEVESGPVRVTRFGDDPQDGDHSDHDDRYVDQENRAPPEVLQQGTADDRADGDTETDRTGPDTDRLATLARVEDIRDDRQGGRQDRGTADASGPGRRSAAGRLRTTARATRGP